MRFVLDYLAFGSFRSNSVVKSCFSFFFQVKSCLLGFDFKGLFLVLRHAIDILLLERKKKLMLGFKIHAYNLIFYF